MGTHPLIEAARDLGPTIQALADDIERDRKLPDELVHQLSDAGFFRVAVPREFGGDEVDPLVVFDALEELGRADASTAWVVLIISANPLMIGNAVGEAVWQQTYGQDPDFRSAGHIGPNGRAVRVDGGYRISGHWKYGSGALHCDYLISGCMRFEGDKPVMVDGQPDIFWFLHRTDDCEILTDSWDTMGLRGSGSHDYVIEDLFVPEDWTFRLGETVYELANPVYKFPALPFAELAGITVGLATAAIAFIRDASRSRRRGPILMCDDPSVQMQVAKAEALTGSARAYMKDVLADVLATLQQREPLTTEQRARFRLAATHAVDSCVRAVDMMAKAGGGSAVYKGNSLERIVRDIRTAATHVQFNDLTYIKSGRLLMDRDPQDPLF